MLTLHPLLTVSVTIDVGGSAQRLWSSWGIPLTSDDSDDSEDSDALTGYARRQLRLDGCGPGCATLTLTCWPEAAPSAPSDVSALPPLDRLYMGADRWSSSAADGSTRARFGSVLAELSFSAARTVRWPG